MSLEVYNRKAIKKGELQSYKLCQYLQGKIKQVLEK